jgi:hypothetical protein
VRGLLGVNRIVQMLFDHVENGEAVLRLEPSPDPVWREVFADTFADLAGRVRLEDDRLFLRVTPKMVHEGRLNGWWVHALSARVQATNAEWRRRRDSGETELTRPRRPAWRWENGRWVFRDSGEPVAGEP